MSPIFARNHLLGLILILGLAGSAVAAEETGSTGVQTKPAFVFRDVPYFHRWSQNEQHEFTPAKQENLEKWSDMVTLNGYPDAHDGNALAARANAVLENYKNHQAMVLKTNSIPRTAEQPAEHLIAVLFARPTFIEVAFTRFRLADGQGFSCVYSHRIYGEKIGDEMSAWLRTNGAAIEKALMEWKSIPSPKTLHQELLRTRS